MPQLRQDPRDHKVATDYSALVAAWNSTVQPPPGVSGAPLLGTMSTAQKLAAMNAWTVAGPAQDVTPVSVLDYLFLNGKLPALQAYATTPPEGASATAVVAAKELTSAQFPQLTIQTSNPAVYAVIAGMIEALAADTNTGITASDAANLLGLAATTIPWWRASTAQGGAGLAAPVAQTDLLAVGLIAAGS